ncbi:MAG: gliding motility-associated C-terminal domain-containing protein, partial [Bacteroidota bacterium]
SLGCDSVATLNLLVNPSTTSTTSITICETELPYLWNNNLYLTSGSYSVTLTSSLGCDSVASLNLIVHPISASTTHLILCEKELPYYWNNNPYNTEGTFTIMHTTSCGCDSVAILQLDVIQVPTSVIDLTVCESSLPYYWNNMICNSSGLYYTNLIASSGCDSLVTLHLNVEPTIITIIDTTVCSGQAYTLPDDSVIYLPGTYTTLLSAQGGCTMISITHLTHDSNPVIQVNNATACVGAPSNLIAGGATTYTWSPEAGLNTTTGSAVQVIISNPMVYTVTGTGSNGCTAQSTATVLINPNPQLAISNSNPQLCAGSGINLLVGGATSYSWSPASGLNSVTASQVTVTAPVSTTYTVTGTNAFGCSDTLVVPVTVNDAPSVITGPDTIICVGASVQLTSASTAPVLWTPGSSLNYATSNNPIATPGQTTTYTVTATGSNGCTAADQVVVQVAGYPVITINGGGVVCLGDEAPLTADGGVSYTWMPETYLNTTTGATVIATPEDDMTYYVTAQNANGCVATDSVLLTVKKPISIEAEPGAAICEGSSYQLMAEGTGISYLWTPAAGLDNPYSPYPTATPEQTTTYTVTTTDGICFTASATAVVTVNPLPEINTQVQVIVMPGSETQLQATSNAAGASYLWTPSAGLSCSTCSNPLANPTEPTVYTVMVTDSSGCRSEEQVRLDFLCSEDGIYVPNAFTPNGDGKNDVFRIRGYGVEYISIFRVYSRWGELMFETTDISQGWDGTYKGELQFPAVYVYYIEGVCTNNQKIVKQGNVSLIR